MADRNEDGTFAPGHKDMGAGRKPKEQSVTAILRRKGETVIDPDTGQTRVDRLAEKLMVLAEGGDKAAIQYIIDRLDGKPKERVEQEGETVVKIVFDNGNTDAPPDPNEVLEQPGEV